MINIPKKNKHEYIRQHAHQIIEDRMIRGGYTYDKLSADEKEAFNVLISSYDYDRFSNIERS